MSCTLSDDKIGKDLTDFRETLKKCPKCYQVNCVNPKNSKQIDLFSNIQAVGNNIITSINMNNYKVELKERQILPLYSFITKKISETMSVKELDKQCAKVVNTAISIEAEKFIDNL